jgi:predicted amidohydrolase YtcJ
MNTFQLARCTALLVLTIRHGVLAAAATRDLLLRTNGTIHTVAPNGSGTPARTRKLCCEANGGDSRVLAVGPDAAAACTAAAADGNEDDGFGTTYRAVETVDLAGVVVLPGLWDAHGHRLGEGQRLMAPWHISEK